MFNHFSVLYVFSSDTVTSVHSNKEVGQSTIGDTQIALLDTIFADIRSVIRMLRRRGEQSEEEVARQQWMLVADVIDRILFWAFVACNAFLLGILFGYRPPNPESSQWLLSFRFQSTNDCWVLLDPVQPLPIEPRLWATNDCVLKFWINLHKPISILCEQYCKSFKIAVVLVYIIGLVWC